MAKKVKGTSGPVNEATAYAEIGGYLYENEGKATVKMHTSVNESLKLDDAVKATRIKKVRVEMNVIEDKSVQGNQIYQKDVSMTQIVDDNNPTTTAQNSYSTGAPVDANQSDPNNQGQGPSGLQVLKNFVDKIADQVKAMWIVIAGLALVTGVAITLAIVL